MFSIFKKSNKQVDVLCSISKKYKITHDLYKPNYSGKMLPTYFRQLPKTYENTNNNGIVLQNSTIKNCVGILSLIGNGFVIPNWTDIIIKVSKDHYAWQCADTQTVIEFLGNDTTGTHWQKKYWKFRIKSPWSISTKDEILFHFTEPFWHYEDLPFWKIVPGVIDFKYNHNTDVVILIPIPEVETQFMIPAGTPLVQCVLLNKEKFNLVYELYEGDRENSEYNTYRTKFSNFYPYYRKELQKLENQEPKCPFKNIFR